MAQGIIQFKAIVPKKLDVDAVLWEVRQELQREGDIERRMLEKTTRTWRHRVEFETKVDLSTNDATVKVWTRDDIYNWLNNGVPRRRIYARRARFLQFRYPFRPKTHTRIIGSGAGGVGDNWARKRSVNWPGIKARRFYEEVQKRRKTQFYKNIQAALTRGLRKAR